MLQYDYEEKTRGHGSVWPRKDTEVGFLSAYSIAQVLVIFYHSFD